MIIYKGYYYFRKYNGKIIKVDYTNIARGNIIGVKGIGHNSGSVVIGVNKKDALDVQIRTVLHEFAHLGLEHDVVMGITFPEESNIDEKDIELEAIKTYNRKPALIEWIERQLKK